MAIRWDVTKWIAKESTIPTTPDGYKRMASSVGRAGTTVELEEEKPSTEPLRQHGTFQQQQPSINDKNVEVIKQVERITQDFKRKANSIDTCWVTTLEKLENTLTAMKDELFNPKEDREISVMGQILIEETSTRAAKLVYEATDYHRDLQHTILKLGKYINTEFEHPTKKPFRPSPELERKRNRRDMGFALIFDYMMSTGLSSVGDSMRKLSIFEQYFDTLNVSDPEKLKTIVEDLQGGDISSSLEFIKSAQPAEEHSLRKSLQTQMIIECIEMGLESYGRTVKQLKAFVPKEGEEQRQSQRLVGALVMGQAAKEDARYRNLFDQKNKEKLVSRLSAFFVPKEAPLNLILKHGFKGINQLTDFQDSGLQWDVWMDWELPFDTYFHASHSVFTCPILKEQCTCNNPPMRLTCGHVISKDAINRLTINVRNRFPRSRHLRFKCPYCPKEQNLDNAKSVDFHAWTIPAENEDEEAEEQVKFLQFVE
ncbi:Protein CBG02109 [Caenorhabditis briggsae]|uniref:Protein CBG02109 n=2 Tax=Caenorhabditis briggsae TaxID=6238 RepID=A8WS02_CAEBR|nr:Protein CBG02109 [Caenorhabditis briggsae]CAP23260.1 Protein CBG02109 [Caenorhabditis briggsae]